jgi:hypothetical protein
MLEFEKKKEFHILLSVFFYQFSTIVKIMSSNKRSGRSGNGAGTNDHRDDKRQKSRSFFASQVII